MQVVTAVVLNLNKDCPNPTKYQNSFRKRVLRLVYMPDFIGCTYIYSFGKVVWCEFQRGLSLRVHVCIQRGWGEAWIQ